MKRENIFILELCKFISPDKDKLSELLEETLNFPYILGQVLFNRMGAAAYFTLESCGLLGKVNREFRTTLKSIYDVGIDKKSSFATAIEMLEDILKNFNFPYALLKGAYLYQSYPKGLRTSNDIDILIEQKNITPLSNILLENDFLQGHIRNGKFTQSSRKEILSSRMNRGETVPFIKKVDLPKMEYLEVDINFSLDYKARQENENVANMLAQTKQLFGKNLYVLSEYDFLIHLCVHLYKEAVVKAIVDMGRDMSLYKFCDLYLLLSEQKNTDFYQGLITRIGELDLNKECYYALFYTKMLFDIKNDMLNTMLTSIEPEDTQYLRQVFNPTDGKVYEFDSDIVDWIFCFERMNKLYEVASIF